MDTALVGQKDAGHSRVLRGTGRRASIERSRVRPVIGLSSQSVVSLSLRDSGAGAAVTWPRVAAASTSTCSACLLLCQEPAPLGVSCESQDDVGWRKAGPSPEGYTCCSPGVTG